MSGLVTIGQKQIAFRKQAIRIYQMQRELEIESEFHIFMLSVTIFHSSRGEGRFLRISDLSYADTGAYMCQGENSAGVQRSVSSLVVQDHQQDGEFLSFYLFNCQLQLSFSVSTIAFEHLSL